MESISETGVINPNIILRTNQTSETEVRKKNSLNEPAAYNEISEDARGLAGEIDKTKMLELLGPSISEKYSDLIVSISKNNNRTENFIERVNQKIDLYA